MAISSIPDKALVIPSYPIWRLSVAQYHEMIHAGILTENDEVELLEGWLVTKMPKGSHHPLATQTSGDILRDILPLGWFVNIQEPITTDDSEPEPDVLIVRGNRRDYAERHPLPSEVALVIEVSDSTLQQDRTLKLRVYAHARIPVYWILNLQAQQLEIYTEPTGEGEAATYKQHQDYPLTDTAPVVIDGQAVGQVLVSELMG